MKNSKITLWPNRIGFSFVLLWCLSIVGTLVFTEWEIGKWWLFIPFTATIYLIPFLISLGVVKLYRFLNRKGNKF